MEKNPKQDKGEIWKQVLASVRVSVSSATYTTWLSKTHLISLKKMGRERYMAEVGCISTFIKGTIEKRYFGLLQDALMKTVSAPTDLTFVVKAFPGQEGRVESSAPLFEEEVMSESFLSKLARARLRPGVTFENFAVSSTNQMAWAASEAVSKKPGESYNPLFIWGGVGVGKTHLMNAVGYTILQKNPEAQVLLCTGEQFTNDIVEGIRNKTTQAFRDRYRKLRALFIDDIQFIAGKDAVQDEFFHTFNAVTASGGQIMMTSDKPPSEIARLEERLRSRFEAGLIVDVGLPDFELRCAIVQIKAKEKGIPLTEELTHMIAGNVLSARQIEGFLMRLSSEAKLRAVPVTDELVRGLISKGEGGIVVKKKSITATELIDAVTKYYSIKEKALMGSARAKIIARPRQILMYLLRTELGLPLAEIGRIMRRDHTTVIHGVETITQKASVDSKIREDIVGIKNSV